MIDHHILENLLSKHFSERTLFNLYWRFVKAGYIEYDGKKQKFIAPDKGVPQGGILSPLLSNVILHEFDMYMEKRRLEFLSASSGQKPTIVNKAYTRLTSIMKTCKDNDLPEMRREAHRIRNKTRYALPNSNYTRMEYVRYADD
jgi:retron-type reverse transcriptase